MQYPSVTLVLLIAVGSASAAERFRTVVLSEQFHSEGAAVADVDGDGSKDIVSGPFWYAGPDFRQRHAYAPLESYSIKGYSKHFFSFVHDFNSDGRPDVLSIPIPGGRASWFENPGKIGVQWKQHAALDGVGGESPEFADLTGDGEPELIAVVGGAFGYAEPDASKPNELWKFTPVTPHRNLGVFTHGMGIGDVDGDGRKDLLETNGWWQQTPTKGELFKFHAVRFAQSGGCQMHVFDVDGDGDNDVVSVQNAHAWGLTWFERRGQSDDDFLFVPHTITTDNPKQNAYGISISQMHALAVADIDGDGVKDVVTGKRFWAHGGADPGAQQLPVLYWFRTVRTGSGVEFVPHLIDQRVGVGTQLTVDDIDDNGHIDIVVGNKLGTFLCLNTGEPDSPPEKRPASPHRAGTAEFASVIRTTEPLAPEDERKTFVLPAGFEAQLVAAEPDIAKPMNIAFDTRGRLWVSSSVEYPFPAKEGETGRDTIKVLEDTDGDGRADRITTFADGLNIPIGLYPYKDGVICFSIPNIWFLRDTDGDGRADKREKLYGPVGFERDTHGMCNAFTRGYDGWLYACHGFNNQTTVAGRDGHEITMHSGNTFRMRLDGSRVEQFTHGQVNPFGMAIDPLGDIFTADCHTKPITLLLKGGYYESFGKPHDGIGFVPSVMNHLHGSTAIGGIALYHASQFPAVYHGNAFAGNVMTSRVNRNSLHYSGSSVRAQEEPDFLISGDPWFRPCDLQVGPDGALYVTDFYTRIIGHYEVPLDHPGRDRERGRIWRIVYTGKDDRRDTPLPSGEGRDARDKASKSLSQREVGQKELIAELDSPNLTQRMLAADRLADEFGEKAIASVRDTLAQTNSDRMRVHCLWLLYRLEAVNGGELERALKDSSDLVRLHAFQVLGAMTRPAAATSDWLRLGFTDEKPLVRRAAVIAATQHQAAELVRPLLGMMHATPSADAHLRHATKMALRDHLQHEDWFQAAVETASPADRVVIADVCLGIQAEFAGDFLARHLIRAEQIAPAKFAEYLTAAARSGSEDTVTVIAEVAREKFKSNLPLQEKLLSSILTGVQQRGTAMPESVHAWALALATHYLDAAEARGAEPLGWAYVPDPRAARQPNPWLLSTRRDSADGKKETPLFSSFPQGEQRIGTYRSDPFELPAIFSFYVAGHDGYPDKPLNGNNLVRVRDAATQAILKQWPPPRNDTAQQIKWETGDAAEREVYVELVDGDPAGAFAWLAVGRFSVSGLNPSTVAQDRRKAAQLSALFKLGELHEPLIAILQRPRLDRESRLQIARAIVAMNPSGQAAALAESLSLAGVQGELRVSITDALIADDFAATDELVGNVMKVASAAEQQRLAAQLTTDREGIESLIALVETGRAGARLLTRPLVQQRMEAVASKSQRDRLTRLTASLPKIDPRLLILIRQGKQLYRARPGDAGRGAEVFQKNCAACHQIEGKGKQVGPNLDGIGNRGLDRLLEDILLPNRNVDVAFRSTTIVTTKGQVISGLAKPTEGERLIVVNNKGEELTIPLADIEERTKSTLSAMPANWGETLDEQKTRDLLAYLLSLTSS